MTHLFFDDDLDRPREACGVFGIYAPGSDVARVAFFALYALQHRGQESAGIATCDGWAAYSHKGMGLVHQVFNEENLRPLKGHLAIGHNRYSTTGGSHLRNAQPYLIETMHGPLGVGHNGNLTNALELRRSLLERGVGLISSSDSEVITQMLALPPLGAGVGKPDWEARLANFIAEAEGAYSLVILTRDAVFAVRDPLGLRPLCIGRIPANGHQAGYVVASESCALGTIGADYVREVEPGEIVRLDQDGLHSVRPRSESPASQAFCIFEYVYFARPDSIIENQTVHQVRQRLGRVLAREAPADADIVVGVPDSATPAAIGYAIESGLTYTEGLTKNRYIGRTFIQPDDRLRRAGVHLKYNPLRANLEGKRVVLVDDSIVRGNTAGPLVRLLRDGGAAEVHVRVSSPPVRNPCFMGIDMARGEELIGHSRTVEEIRQHIGADSLAYLSHEGMLRAVQAGIDAPTGHCSACFTGNYPIHLEEYWTSKEKLAFEGVWG
ncbi:MAG: amidophosphoribosyltransferase [Caldilineae bacterium]|nr:amidophosphoribosyltransferase [Anaerolineae bacterium]MCB0203303.1 amidophosphoribosyltransferase [Anaerolineae bacterium]MCB0253826.1 amidophosphoribosyltransferase [Anaerolineae bacterium]MCB9154041.1 amidophosphoribosyltransferase [Caldilineae bacterium]